MNNPSRRSFFGFTTGGLAVLAGCSPTRGTAVPIEQTQDATVLGVPNERFFPFYGTDPLEAEFQAAGARLLASRGLAPNAQLGQIRLLSVSGGGENGAFGAGVLCGWSDHGTRPVFELVTGVRYRCAHRSLRLSWVELRSATAFCLYRSHRIPRALEAVRHCRDLR